MTPTAKIQNSRKTVKDRPKVRKKSRESPEYGAAIGWNSKLRVIVTGQGPVTVHPFHWFSCSYPHAGNTWLDGLCIRLLLPLIRCTRTTYSVDSDEFSFRCWSPPPFAWPSGKNLLPLLSRHRRKKLHSLRIWLDKIREFMDPIL